jgi:hypothetical protein
MTLATRANNGHGVIGADILLETLNVSLARQKVTPGTRVVLANANGMIVAHDNHAGAAAASSSSAAQAALTRIEDFGVPVLAQMAGDVRSMPKQGGQQGVAHTPGDGWRILARFHCSSRH